MAVFDETKWHDCHLWHPVFIDGRLRWPSYAIAAAFWWMANGAGEYRAREETAEEFERRSW